MKKKIFLLSFIVFLTSCADLPDKKAALQDPPTIVPPGSVLEGTQHA